MKPALRAPALARQPVSVTRKMAASLPRLRAMAEDKGLAIHHLGAGYPNPEVTDPRGFIAHEQAFFEHLRRAEGLNDPAALPEFLRECYAYTDTLGPAGPRESFAAGLRQGLGRAHRSGAPAAHGGRHRRHQPAVLAVRAAGRTGGLHH